MEFITEMETSVNANDIPKMDYSAIREKLVYVSPTSEQYELLLKRTKEQLNEGRGETIIEVYHRFIFIGSS